MKKVMLALVGLMCVSLCFAGDEDVVKPKGCGSGRKEVIRRSSCFDKKIKNHLRRAEYYRKKADLETNKDLAGIYTECAEAKQKVADGLTKIQASSEKCQKVYASNPEIKAALSDNMKDCGLEKRKKRTHLSTIIKNVQKCAEMCREKAKQTDGKEKLTQQYDEIAAAMQEKSEGLERVVEGRKEFRNARKKLKEQKLKEKESKTDTEKVSNE